MRIFEVLFLLFFAVWILWLMLDPIHRRLKSWNIAMAGISLIVLGAVFEGLRW